MPGRLTIGTAYRNNQAANAAEITARLSAEARIYRDVEDGGPGEIRGETPSGLTTFDGTPGHARVYLLDRKSLRMIRGTRSAADGTYHMTNLVLGREFIVMGVDENDQDNAVIMDRIQAGVPS